MQKEIEITLPGGGKLAVPKGTAVSEILGKMGHSRDGWIAAQMNGQLVDLSRKIEEEPSWKGSEPIRRRGLKS